MVSSNDLDRAMETVFYGTQDGEYAGLIEKINNYRSSVLLTFKDTVKEQQSKGIEYSNIVKYGMQSVPVTANADVLSDGLVAVEEGSFGAVAAFTGEKFSDKYINGAVKNGKGKFISPDSQIDASTCLAPESTWFIKNYFICHFPNALTAL